MRTSTGICSGGSSTFGRSFARSHDRLERGEQAEEIDLELRLVVVAGDRRDPLVGPLPLRRPHLLALVQQAGGRLELLVLEQPADQRVARILLLALDAGGGLRAAAAASST